MKLMNNLSMKDSTFKKVIGKYFIKQSKKTLGYMQKLRKIWRAYNIFLSCYNHKGYLNDHWIHQKMLKPIGLSKLRN